MATIISSGSGDIGCGCRQIFQRQGAIPLDSLQDLYKPADSRALFIAAVASFGLGIAQGHAFKIC